MTAVIHKKLYVTVQYRSDAGGSDGLLGFAGPYTKDSAFEKRKNTQDKWAYGYGAKVEIDAEDTITVTGDGGSRGGLGGGQKWDMTMLFIANCHPRIVDNDPVAGFEIAKSVRRSGWNGSGNVKWRITDPRGFDLEISSENFAKVIDCCTMINGVIQEECVWGREGKDNILLPVTSEPYQEAAKQTIRVNQSVSLKDLQLGDWVDLVNPYLEPEGDAGLQYLGKYFIYGVEQYMDKTDRHYYNTQSGRYDLLGTVSERYLFRNDKGKIQAIGSPKVSSIITKIDVPLVKTEVEAGLRQLVCAGGTFDNCPTQYPVLVTGKKLKDGEATFEMVPADVSAVKREEGWPASRNCSYYQYALLLVCKYKDEWYIAGNNRKEVRGQYNTYTTEAVLLPALTVTNQNIAVKMTTQYSGNSWSRYESRHHSVIDDIDLAQIEAYTYCVRYGDCSYPIHTLGLYVQ